MTANRALIVGIAGQDGSYLAELLLDEGYEVFGVVRGSTSATFENLEPFRDRLELRQADIRDEPALVDLLSSVRPHEVYNLAAPSFVPRSWELPVATAEVVVLGVTALLEAIRRVDASIRFFNAASNEMFGAARESPQTEETPLAPVSPYGAAKAYGHFLTGCFRRYHGLHASSGILYNARVAAAVTRLPHAEGHARGRRDQPRARERGPAREPRRASRLGLRRRRRAGHVAHAPGRRAGRLRPCDRREPQRPGARGGRLRARRPRPRGARARGRVAVRGNAELGGVLGDATRARERLGWTPTVGFESLVRMLVDADLERLRAQLETAERTPGER